MRSLLVYNYGMSHYKDTEFSLIRWAEYVCSGMQETECASNACLTEVTQLTLAHGAGPVCHG